MAYKIQSCLPSSYTKRWLKRKLQSNITTVQMTVKVQDSDDMHNSKISAAEDHQ
jgi:hypothetical protein